MEHYQTTFFCNSGKRGDGEHGPRVSVDYFPKSPWPLTVKIFTSQSSPHSVVISLDSVDDWTGFVNSVLNADEEVKKQMEAANAQTHVEDVAETDESLRDPERGTVFDGTGQEVVSPGTDPGPEPGVEG